MQKDSSFTISKSIHMTFCLFKASFQGWKLIFPSTVKWAMHYCSLPRSFMIWMRYVILSEEIRLKWRWSCNRKMHLCWISNCSKQLCLSRLMTIQYPSNSPDLASCIFFSFWYIMHQFMRNEFCTEQSLFLDRDWYYDKYCSESSGWDFCRLKKEIATMYWYRSYVTWRAFIIAWVVLNFQQYQ
jgi:hypothetical protein